MTRWRYGDREGRPGWAAAALVLAASLAAGGQALAEEGAVPQDEPPQAQDGAEAVTCLLPAGITRYGDQLTVVAPRRQIETTRADCEARAGEVVGEAGGDPEASG